MNNNKSNKNKRFSVKGFIYEEVKNSPYKDKVLHKIRKLTVLGKHLNWKSAKELRNQYSAMKAFITVDVVDEELKVIKIA